MKKIRIKKFVSFIFEDRLRYYLCSAIIGGWLAKSRDFNINSEIYRMCEDENSTVNRIVVGSAF